MRFNAHLSESQSSFMQLHSVTSSGFFLMKLRGVSGLIISTWCLLVRPYLRLVLNCLRPCPFQTWHASRLTGP